MCSIFILITRNYLRLYELAIALRLMYGTVYSGISTTSLYIHCIPTLMIGNETVVMYSTRTRSILAVAMR